MYRRWVSFLERVNLWEKRAKWKPQFTPITSEFYNCFIIGIFQLTGNVSGMKIGLVKEGFGHTGAESDVEELVRQAASCIQTRLGAKVQEISIPMHLDGEICSAESRLSTMHLVKKNSVKKWILFCPFLFLVAGNQTYIT